MATSTYTIPAYGSNVANFDPKNAQHVALADAGQEWAKAKAAGDAAAMAAAAAKGQDIRSQVGGNTAYDSKTGITSFDTSKNEVNQTPTTPAAATSNPSSNLINSIYDNNLAAQMQALKKARDTALQGLNGIETTAKQTAYDNRNSADVVAAQNAQKLRELMAANGLLESGDNITASTNLAAQRQGAINDINRGEANTLTDVAQRRALINDNAAGDEQSLLQQLAAARDNMILNQYNADRSFGLQEAGLTGLYNGQRTLQGQSFDWGKTMDTAGLTGYLNGQRTLQGQQFDFQKTQQEWENMFKQNQFNEDKAARLWEQAFKEKSFAQDVKDAAAARGLQWASLNQREKEFVADQAFREKQFAFEQKKYTDSLTGNSKELQAELDGLYTGLSQNKISPTQAISEVDNRLRLGLVSANDAAKMKSFIQTYMEGGSGGKPQTVNPALLQMNGDQLEKAWETDPSGKAAGRALLDWRRWIQDPNGYKAGKTFEMWFDQYGPRLGG